MTASGPLESFLRHLQVERGLSPNTSASYGYQLTGYLKFIESLCLCPASARRDNILAYLEGKKMQGLKSASLFAAAVAIRQFHRFLHSEGRVDADPTAGMRLPKFKQRLPDPLSVADIEKLLGNPGTKFNPTSPTLPL